MPAEPLDQPDRSIQPARPPGSFSVSGQHNIFDVEANQELTVNVHNPGATGALVRVMVGHAEGGSKVAGAESMTSFVGPLGGQFSFTTAKFGESPVFHRVRVDVSGEAHVMVFFTTRGAVPAAGK